MRLGKKNVFFAKTRHTHLYMQIKQNIQFILNETRIEIVGARGTGVVCSETESQSSEGSSRTFL